MCALCARAFAFRFNANEDSLADVSDADPKVSPTNAEHAEDDEGTPSGAMRISPSREI